MVNRCLIASIALLVSFLVFWVLLWRGISHDENKREHKNIELLRLKAERELESEINTYISFRKDYKGKCYVMCSNEIGSTLKVRFWRCTKEQFTTTAIVGIYHILGASLRNQMLDAQIGWIKLSSRTRECEIDLDNGESSCYPRRRLKRYNYTSDL